MLEWIETTWDTVVSILNSAASILKMMSVIIPALLLTLAAAFVVLWLFRIYLFVLFRFPGVSGDAEVVSHFWMKQRGPTCAINIQSIVLKIFGVERDESELSKRQGSFGKFDPRLGSKTANFLLRGYGIKTEIETLVDKSVGACLFVLWKHLRQGKLIIVHVNSHELNIPDLNFTSNEIPVADHVILVTAIEKTTSTGIYLYYCDTALEQGATKKIQGRNLISASNRQIIITPRVPDSRMVLSRLELTACFIALGACFAWFLQIFHGLLYN